MTHPLVTLPDHIKVKSNNQNFFLNYSFRKKKKNNKN